MFKLIGTVLLVSSVCGGTGLCAVPGPGTSTKVFSPPNAARLRADVRQWMEFRQLIGTPLVEAIEPEWQLPERPTTEQLYDALMRTFYMADDDVRRLVDSCRWKFSPELLQLQSSAGERDEREPLLTNNVRYFLGRHLARLGAFNEALELLRQADLNFVVDPAGCLFQKAVCEHHLLLKDEGLATLAMLLDQTEGVPVRYRQLAVLMKEDLDAVETESLSEVARQMKDVERRLSLGKTDEGVQEVEDKIIATLDKLIQQMEEQQQQSSSSAAGAGNAAPSDPAKDSYLGGVKGKGETDKKDLGHKDNWGDLPPKTREAAKNLLERQFPPHYRQAVEEYLKKIADRPAPQR